jgi:hypothetical protein
LLATQKTPAVVNNPKTGRSKTDRHKYSLSLDSLAEYHDAMTNGQDGTIPDTEMGGSEQPPPAVALGQLNAQQKWLSDRFDAFQTTMHEVQAKANWTQHQLEITQADLAAARQEIAVLKAAGPKQDNAGKDEAKGADPPLFTGSQKDLEGWVTACRLRFAGQPSKFNTEEKKVVHATSFMRGPPMAWFQPIINAYSARGNGDPPPEFQSFETFVQSIRTLYGDPNLERNSEAALQHLKQGDGSVAVYISRFATHSQYTNFNDSALASQFYRNLHKDIKNALVTKEWSSLKELQNIATKLDARARERKFEIEQEAKSEQRSTSVGNNPPRRSDGTFLPAKSPFQAPVARAPPTTNPFSSSAPAPPAPAADGSTPMELDSLRLGRLTLEERARCVREGRCFRCRLKGHDKVDCPRTVPMVAGMDVQLAENDSAQE